MFRPEIPASDSPSRPDTPRAWLLLRALSATLAHPTHLLVEFKNLGISLMAAIPG